MRAYFSNLGCKLNQAEMERLTRVFSAAGHVVVNDLAEADLHVINSCTVTHVAARDSRKLARRGRRFNPGIRTVLTGCYTSHQPERAAALAGVDLVVPNAQKERLLDVVRERLPELSSSEAMALPEPVPFEPLELGRCRALVKIEDGCNMRCAFCVIPMVRGAERSRPPEEIIREVRGLVARGHREVVVTGVQISSYRYEKATLFDLVAALLGQTELERLRLTSIAPWEFDPRLLNLWSDPRLCRHVHLSLQSGCDATLRRMRRPYTAEIFAALVAQIRAAVPDVAITTDVIVGFPGESPVEFEQSLSFVDQMIFARVHVFSFSPRPGTEATSLPDQVSDAEKKRRVTAMISAAGAGEREFLRRHLEQRVEVLWEARKLGEWQGLTGNYVRVFVDSGADLANRITEARVIGLRDGGVQAQLVACDTKTGPS